MAGLIFLVLPLSLLLVATVVIVALVDAAFRQAFISECESIKRGTRSAGDWLPMLEVAATLDRLTGAPSSAVQRAGCQCESFVPMVTEPEARMIADDLRQRGAVTLERVMERSRHPGRSCPMLTEKGLCACAICPPLACIGRCAVGGDSPEWATGLGQTMSDAFRHHLQARHVNATTRRLDQALVDLIDSPRT